MLCADRNRGFLSAVRTDDQRPSTSGDRDLARAQDARRQHAGGSGEIRARLDEERVGSCGDLLVVVVEPLGDLGGAA